MVGAQTRDYPQHRTFLMICLAKVIPAIYGLFSNRAGKELSEWEGASNNRNRERAIRTAVDFLFTG